jgi:HPt (histidine-containing phosphotransfer) domain-containing protein
MTASTPCAAPEAVMTDDLDSLLAPARARFRELIVARVLSFESLRQQAASGEDARQALTGISDLAHKISGTSATLGFARLGALAATVERSIAEGRRKHVPPAQVLAVVDPLLESLLDEMEVQIDA